MLGSILNRLRLVLILQAVVTGGLAVAGPWDAGRWLPLAAGVAGGALVLAWFVGTLTRSAWTMTLGFVLLAVAVGGCAVAADVYLPGTVFALAAAALLVTPAGRAAFVSSVSVSAAAPVRLTPPPVVAAVPQPSAPPPPPAFPPPGVLLSATAPTSLPPVLPPPAMPPAPLRAPVRQLGGTILPGR